MTAAEIERGEAAHASLEDEYLRLYPTLKRVAFLMTGSDAAAEDAVQEVFARCATRVVALADPGSYLRAAVVNECRGQWRKAQRIDLGVVADGEVALPVGMIEMRDALLALSDRERAAVVLRYFVDLPDFEIAEILGCRPATVRSLVHRALPRLREMMR